MPIKFHMWNHPFKTAAILFVLSNRQFNLLQLMRPRFAVTAESGVALLFRLAGRAGGAFGVTKEWCRGRGEPLALMWAGSSSAKKQLCQKAAGSKLGWSQQHPGTGTGTARERTGSSHLSWDMGTHGCPSSVPIPAHTHGK